ncbi:DME family drug/metabolite transporter [Bacillus tianshenii]|uniref:DME family drug/metabolite transporter n=1 Tax=Sutcliffiella tianshenii TaxID=1463404 RepID=A0ABS2NZA0_9BACI|nr:EamA family transporter [Bacillus tianshenii]MBM7619944.1 DME family drug/metabolite transporter [Bacillus tianshenii]
MKQSWGPLWILLAAFLWGTTGTAQTFAPETAHPIAIGAARLAAISMAIFQPLFFSSVTITGVAIGTVITIGSAPILSGVLEWFFLKKTPSKIWKVSTGLSIIGCLLLFLNKGSVHVDPYGILMALGAGLAFAFYALVSRKLITNHSSLSVVAVVFSLSAIFLSPFLFIYEMSWIKEFSGAVVTLHLGIVTTGIAYLLFAKGLATVPSSTAVTLSLGEPLTAAIFGVFILKEQLDLTSWIGISLLLVGIALLIGFPQKKKGR